MRLLVAQSIRRLRASSNVAVGQNHTQELSADAKGQEEMKKKKRVNYHRGRDFEIRVRDDLRDRGYFVIRSAGSKTGADLVAFKVPRKCVLVQCTTGSSQGKIDAAKELVFKTGFPVVIAWRGKQKEGWPIKYVRVLRSGSMIAWPR